MSIFFLGLTKDLLAIHASFEERANKSTDQNMVKVAFDTRRINSEIQINPRRNLQNYQRSEPFISPEISNKIKNLFKVKNAADLIKDQFLGDPEWLDSKSRMLCNAVDNTLRVEQKDYDFFKPQFDYLDELLYLRYRLASEDLERLPEEEIKNILLSRDERLMHKSIYAKYAPSQTTVKTGDSEDSLTKQLFGNVKADKHNKSVERSINIIIKDSILDGDLKKTSEENK